MSRSKYSRTLKSIFFGTVMGFAVFLVSPLKSASAQIYGDILAGPVFPSGNNSLETRFGYGADLGFKLAPGFGLGGYYLKSSGDCKGTTISCNVSFYGGEATLYLALTGLNAGVRVGSSKLEVASGGVSVSTNRFAWGPKFGWDTSFMVLPIAFGVEYNPMFVSSSDSGSAKFTMHNVMGKIGFRF